MGIDAAYVPLHVRRRDTAPPANKGLPPMKTYPTLLKTAALAAVLLAAPAAFASEKVEPAFKERITAHLAAQGYDVRKVKMEDGRIEIYAVKDGQAMEFYLDGQLNIVKGKDEDSEDSEDSES
jgi:hypothetical protein